MRNYRITLWGGEPCVVEARTATEAARQVMGSTSGDGIVVRLDGPTIYDRWGEPIGRWERLADVSSGRCESDHRDGGVCMTPLSGGTCRNAGQHAGPYADVPRVDGTKVDGWLRPLA